MEKKKNIGALWKKVSKQGNNFMSGYVEIEGTKHNITVFVNQYKKAGNAPDFTILPAYEFKEGSKPENTSSRQQEDDDDINGYQEIPF